MGWEQISTGTFTRIGVGSAAIVFVIDSNGAVSRFSGDINNPWVRFPGTMKTDITAASDGTVWAIDEKDDFFRWDKTKWVSNVGQLHRISAGSSSSIWATRADGNVYRHPGDDSVTARWIQFPGNLPTDIGAAADGTVWALAADHRIYRWQSKEWVEVGGSLKAVGVGSYSDVWGVDPNGNIYRFTDEGSKNWPWVGMPGSKFVDIDVGIDGTVWAVKEDGSVHRWNPYK